MRKALVTGAAGFIGSHLVKALLSRGTEVVALDNFSSGHEGNLAGLDCEIHRASIEDREAVDIATADCDFVFHLAAEVSVARSVMDPLSCLQTNGLGMLNVLEAARERGVEKFLFASSAAVYGEGEELPKHERLKPEPISPYAITKLDGELYLQMYRQEYGMSSAALRFFNVYGAGQDPRGAYAAAVPIFMQRAGNGEDITVHGDGSQTRDFIHVDDVVRGLLFAAENKDLQGVYNLAGGNQVSVNELVKQILAITGSNSKVLHGSRRPGDIQNSYADVRLIGALGYRATIDLREGLSRMWDAGRLAM